MTLKNEIPAFEHVEWRKKGYSCGLKYTSNFSILESPDIHFAHELQFLFLIAGIDVQGATIQQLRGGGWRF